jgi:hypothetical protein
MPWLLYTQEKNQKHTLNRRLGETLRDVVDSPKERNIYCPCQETKPLIV